MLRGLRKQVHSHGGKVQIVRLTCRFGVQCAAPLDYVFFFSLYSGLRGGTNNFYALNLVRLSDVHWHNRYQEKKNATFV